MTSGALIKVEDIGVYDPAQMEFATLYNVFLLEADTWRLKPVGAIGEMR